MGIAHGDISLMNLMYTVRDDQYVGILNDFDLAAIMKPGKRNPEKIGWERTGSIGFMAMDLLKHSDGEQKRWYRHDVESFLWCLVWEVLEDPPDSWIEDGPAKVYSQKGTFCRDIADLPTLIKPEWRFVLRFLTNWVIRLREASIRVSRNASNSLLENHILTTIDISNQDDGKKEDSEHVRLITESAKNLKGSDDIPALNDMSWVGVELNNM